MQIGCHVSISGSIDKAVDNAIERECTAFQIFTRSPRSWHAKKLDDVDVKTYKKKLDDSKIDRFATVAHMPYLPNLATPNPDAYSKSVDTFQKEVERCGQLGIPYLVTHLGSHLGTGEENGIKRLVKALEKAAEVKSDVMILLENTAGQKNSVGSDFKQLAEIFFQLKPAKRFGICFDTCHTFAAGYNLRTKVAVKETLHKFDEAVGFEYLKILHLNDSKGKLRSQVDRHYHIGLGGIGKEGLGEVVKFMNNKKIPIILETPIDDIRDDFENIRIAKELA
ncbi:MAG: deoxyribonuclease IV [Thaumarchaeota archaeon]|jgi:deoxyribonuclease-4|nr:deoxyribonuclease IV [Nitrososphaerota archaeon]